MQQRGGIHSPLKRINKITESAPKAGSNRTHMHQRNNTQAKEKAERFNSSPTEIPNRIKEAPSRRQTPRPEPIESTLWINLLTAGMVGLCFIIAYLLQSPIKDVPHNILYRYFLPFLIICLPTVGMFYIRNRLIASLSYRDGMIKRLNRDLFVKSQDTIHHDKQLKHLIESSNVCPWSAHLESNCFTYIAPQIANITGIPAEDWTTSGFLLEHALPSDRISLVAAFKSLNKGGFTTLEYRVRGENGKIIWIRNSFCEIDYSAQENNSPSEDGAEEENKKKNIPFQKIVQGFITDITEQKNVEEALREASYAAEKASKTKSNFLASMSHELRTPLNSIIGFSEIMRTEVFGKIGEQYKEYADNIHSSGKHLLDLINDILDFSKIEAGKFDVVKDAVDLKDIFRSCEILLRERASRGELALKILAPLEPLMIEVDAKRMKQVLINLLSNSIKFTKAGGSIALEYDISDNDELVIIVKDTGIGIKPEDIDHVFEKFHQVDAEKNRDQEGTGLGLSIAKSLVELHGGEFFLDSIYNHGTTIKLVFPRNIFYVPKAKAPQSDTSSYIQNSSFAKKD